MEKELGVKLFQRGARKITLTNEGMLLRRRAEEIVELVDRTVAELPLQEKEVEGIIAIGSGEVAGMEVLAQICSAFREKHPKVPFDFSQIMPEASFIITLFEHCGEVGDYFPPTIFQCSHSTLFCTQHSRSMNKLSWRFIL